MLNIAWICTTPPAQRQLLQPMEQAQAWLNESHRQRLVELLLVLLLLLLQGLTERVCVRIPVRHPNPRAGSAREAVARTGLLGTAGSAEAGKTRAKQALTEAAKRCAESDCKPVNIEPTSQPRRRC